MENIIQRLKTASETCVTTYETWDKAKADETARETLQEALHELRKATARLEIEIAVSERKEAPQRPMPIPPHRDAQRPKGDKLSFDRSQKRTPAKSAVTDEDDDNTGNSLPSFISGNGGDDDSNGGGRSRGGRARGGKSRGGKGRSSGGSSAAQESDSQDAGNDGDE
ncbi:MAG: hypothetical protein AB7E85_02875 [Pseudobdellovibrionaceae bacterium]